MPPCLKVSVPENQGLGEKRFLSPVYLWPERSETQAHSCGPSASPVGESAVGLEDTPHPPAHVGVPLGCGTLQPFSQNSEPSPLASSTIHLHVIKRKTPLLMLDPDSFSPTLPLLLHMCRPIREPTHSLPGYQQEVPTTKTHPTSRNPH